MSDNISAKLKDAPVVPPRTYGYTRHTTKYVAGKEIPAKIPETIPATTPETIPATIPATVIDIAPSKPNKQRGLLGTVIESAIYVAGYYLSIFDKR